MRASALRPPGIFFEPRAPRGDAALPRMDVAAFVGFAASGPLHLPVPVEDLDRFHELFGEDQPLAWDDERRERTYAELAPAVRAFFRGGGVRCWVVRVADEATAVSNRFLLPGLLAARAGEIPGAAAAAARSPGSWSDALAVGAGLTTRPVAVASAEDGWSLSGVAGGDLLRLDFDDGTVAFHPVAARPDDAARRTRTLRPAEIPFWFRPVLPGEPGSTPNRRLARPPVARWLTGPPEGSTNSAADDPDVPLLSWGWREGVLFLTAERAAGEALPPGAWLRLDLRPGLAPADAHPVILAQVSVDPGAAGTLGDGTVRLDAPGAWWVTRGPPAGAAPPRATVVELELRVRRGASTRVLSGLGLAPGHPRFWGAVPDDAGLFGPGDERERAAHAAIRAAVDAPRFALAATAGGAERVLIPLGAGGTPGEPPSAGPVPRREPALRRDGLGTFSSALFLDRALADATAETLLAEAFQLRYVIHDPAAPGSPRPGRALTGVHALLALEEPAMVAAPDAVHRGWRREPRAHAPLAAPELLELSSAEPDALRVRWAAAEGAEEYRVQASRDPRFAAVAAEWRLAVGEAAPAAAPVDTRFRGAACSAPGEAPALTLRLSPDACPVRYFFRVRAVLADAGATPWSATRWHAVPPAAFRAPAGGQRPAPVLGEPTVRGAGVKLTWDVAADDAEFVLERSADPTFAVAEAVYRGPRRAWRAWGAPDRATYFRVAATVAGRPGPWSATVAAGRAEAGSWRAPSPDEYDDDATGAAAVLPKVHLALLRLCAARGDLHAVLGLPLHFRRERARAHAAALRARAEAESERVASFGALFHPWPVVRETAGLARASTWPVAPDGTVCGALAARTLAAGAWASPANRPLAGVAGLEPAPGPDAGDAAEAGVNLLAQTPRGFVAATCLTLASDGELRELHVRRLLILLRRLALREGTALVFQNLDDALHRLAQRRFEEVLGGLYARGALRGATPGQAFRVTTDATVNPRAALEGGRFTVELRVAPSHPLRFVTVRLLETGGGLLAAEEA